MSHGHSHGSGCCNCDDGFEIATDFALHTKISECGFECLGEEIEGSGRKVFKDYENKSVVWNEWRRKFIDISGYLFRI